MSRRSIIHKIRCILYTCLVLFVATGCGKKNVDYISDENTDNVEIVATKTLKEQYEIPDSWTETGVGINNNVSIEAQITVPDATAMCVLDMSRKQYDAKAKKELIEYLNEGKVYKYDFQYYTKDMILPYLEAAQESIDYATETGMFNEYAYLEDMYYDELEKYSTAYENAPEELILADDYENNEFLIEYNGYEYDVYIHENEIGMDLLHTYKDVYGGKQESYYGIQVDYETTVTDDSDNMCTISKENAKKMAVDFLETIEIYDFGVIDILPAYFNGEGDAGYDAWHNGYTVVFGREIDGVIIDGSKQGITNDTNMQNDIAWLQFSENTNVMEFDWEKDPGIRKITVTERIYVVINDEGVISFKYENPLVMENIQTDNVQLLSFDNIKNYFLIELENKEYYEKLRYIYCDLMYFPYKNVENTDDVAIIPVWVLNNVMYKNPIIVNAIDGSIVNLGSQYIEIISVDE